MSIDVSILDYWGKFNNYVIVLLYLIYNDKYFDGLCIYNNNELRLVVDDDLEKELGCDIKNHNEYDNIIDFLKKRLVPYDEIINIVNDISNIFITNQKQQDT